MNDELQEYNDMTHEMIDYNDYLTVEMHVSGLDSRCPIWRRIKKAGRVKRFHGEAKAFVWLPSDSPLIDELFRDYKVRTMIARTLSSHAREVLDFGGVQAWTIVWSKSRRGNIRSGAEFRDFLNQQAGKVARRKTREETEA